MTPCSHLGSHLPLRALSILLTALVACAAPSRADLEEDFGRLAARYFEQEYGLCRSPVLTRWVEALGRKVAAAGGLPADRVHFGVLNSGEINAFALPGGFIFCDAGLLGHVDSDDDLAAVLAHEVAHVQGRDFQRVLLRQALLSALALALDRGDTARAVPALRVFQILDGLRQSRKQEAQADSAAVGLCLEAGYDPAGLENFLGRVAEGQSRWSYWKTLFSTHPEPLRRLAWVRLRSDQMLPPADRLSLAESLCVRSRYQRALAHLALAEEQAPDLAAAPLLAAQVYLYQGRRQEAEAACARAQRLDPADERAATFLAQARQLPQSPPAGAAWCPSADLKQRSEQVLAALAAQEEQRRALQERITTETRRLRTNQQFNQALEAAQSVAAQADSPAYYGLLAQAAALVIEISRLSDQVMEMRWIEYDLPEVLTGEAHALLRERPAARAPVEFERAAEHLLRAASLGKDKHLPALEKMARAATQARRLAGQVAPLFLELLGSGQGRPLGRLVFSRAALMQGQLELARHGLRQAEAGVSDVLRDLCEVKQAYFRARLARLGAEASPAQLGVYQRVLAQVADLLLGPQPDLAWLGGDLGTAAQRLLTTPSGLEPGEEKPVSAGKGPWHDRAYAEYVLLRLALRRCEEETLNPASGQ